MTKFERHQNRFWQIAFDLLAVVAFIGALSGATHHIFTGAICLILARAFKYENQKS